MVTQARVKRIAHTSRGVRKRIDLFVPLTLNNGTSVPRAVMEQVEKAVLACFSACTLHRSLRGLWVSRDGLVYREPIMVIEIVTEEKPELLAVLISLAAMVCLGFQQEEVFLTIREIEAVSVVG